jgi:hypothetical protein
MSGPHNELIQQIDETKQSKDFILGYVNDIVAHLDAGGKIYPANVRELIAFVRQLAS